MIKNSNKNFWEEWDNLTPQEEKAIKVIKQARELLLENFSEGIVALYVYGSFVRREMKEDSDIDIWSVVNDDSYIEKIYTFSKEWEHKTTPSMGLSQAYSIHEFETNKNHPSKKLHPWPSRFLRRLRSNKAELIYGELPDNPKFIAMSDQEALDTMVDGLRDIFIPLMRKREMGFNNFIKNVYELAEAELSLQGHGVIKSWEQMTKFLPKDHPIHKSWEYRLNLPRKDKELQQKFVDEVEEYIKKYE